MAPPTTAVPRTTTRSRATPVSAPTPATRVTRLRAAKESAATSPATLGKNPPTGATGFLAKGRAELRKVSDKLKEKEKEKEAAKEAAKKAAAENTYTQQLQAYLRIRPSPTDSELQLSPYLELQDEKNVVMRQPADSGRAHLAKPPHVYSFDRVFAPETSQADFFSTTTLPLVEKLLQGDNGLVFAYGVSNSGKSYSIQGQTSGLNERGAVPRAIDVVFNSIKGHESKANLKCQGLADVILTDEDEISLHSLPMEAEDGIDDTIKVDRNYSYAVFVSYVEVYNEKIFDLLDSVLPQASRPKLSHLPRTMSIGVGASSAALGSSMSLAAMANGGGGVLKRRALVLKNDPEGTGKYMSGLHEIRVRTREEALAVFRSGQRARQVFGTMANRESSRSHGILTLKVVRVHNGAPEDPDSAQVSRLSIVDLAGSERTRNTGTTGDRLKEAGNINKSLMVLGQCLEVLRANQQKMAAPGPLSARKKVAIVPFRHSKLTEIFQSFFVGDGRAVMVVHVNPYDTGFDENSHVMRFSAIAREIQTTAVKVNSFPTLKRQISSQLSAVRNVLTGHHHTGQKIKVVVPVMPKTAVTPVTVATSTSSFSRPTASSNSRTSTALPRPTTRVPSRTPSRPPTRPQTPREAEPEVFEVVEEEIEVIEEDAEEEEDDDHDYLVDYLFEQLKELKTMLYESEMRNASLEVEIREECALDMQESIQRLNAAFNERLKTQAAFGEEKADMKLDIMQRALEANEGDTSFDESFATDDAGNTTMESVESVLNDDEDDPFAPSPPGKSTHADKPGLIHFDKVELEPVTQPAASLLSESEGEDESESEAETASEGDITRNSIAEADVSHISHASAAKDVEETHSENEYAGEDSDSDVTEGASGFHDGDVTRESEASHAGEVSGDFETTAEVEEKDEPMDVDEKPASGAQLQAHDVAEDDDAEEGSVDFDEENDSEEDSEEDDEEDEEDEEEEDSFADSSFAETASTVSSEPSPPRRMSRKTISPTKRVAGTPVKKTAASRTPKVSTAKGTPLVERMRQDSEPIAIPISDSDDDEVAIVKAPKSAKKRTLGKRIVTEDEIEAQESRAIGGAEVRRMVRGV